MKHRKAMKRLARRSKSYEETIARLKMDNAKGYKRPGSMKK